MLQLNRTLSVSTLLVASVLFAAHAHASSRCMPQVLAAALNEFSRQEQSGGVVARNLHGDLENLGTTLSFYDVTIQDTLKNTFWISLPVHNYTNSQRIGIVRFDAYVVNQNCSIRLEANPTIIRP